MEVTCINNKHRPNEIPTSRWLVEGKEYTIIKVMRMKVQGGIAGVKIEEINNDDLFPWTYFRLDRFGIPVSKIEELVTAGELEEEFV